MSEEQLFNNIPSEPFGIPNDICSTILELCNNLDIRSDKIFKYIIRIKQEGLLRSYDITINSDKDAENAKAIDEQEANRIRKDILKNKTYLQKTLTYAKIIKKYSSEDGSEIATETSELFDYYLNKAIHSLTFADYQISLVRKIQIIKLTDNQVTQYFNFKNGFSFKSIVEKISIKRGEYSFIRTLKKDGYTIDYLIDNVFYSVDCREK
jgi:hypothetical protein